MLNEKHLPNDAKWGSADILLSLIWQEYLDIVEAIQETECGNENYAQCKETIERVFADAKEKHAMCYTHQRGLAAVTRWVRLKYAAMNLKNGKLELE